MSLPAPITRLLVVDDDPLLREVLTQLLRSDGFNVTSSDSGDSAIMLLENGAGPFDAILTDLQMPGTGGLELAPRLREISSNAVLVGMSARPPALGEQASFDAFLVKPFSSSDLRFTLEQAWLNRANAGKAEGFSRQTSHGLHGAVDLGDTLPERESVLAKAQSQSSQELLVTLPVSPDKVLDQRIFDQLQAALGSGPLRELYEMTANDVHSRLSRMHASLALGDQEEIRREAHAIKGGCSMVGAIELSRLAAGIEGGSETDSAQLALMQEACRRLRHVVTIVSP